MEEIISEVIEHNCQIKEGREGGTRAAVAKAKAKSCLLGPLTVKPYSA